MTSARPEEPGLADAVRAGAGGLYSFEAACDLIIGAGWLHRDDFARFVTTAAPVTGGATDLAHIDWQSAIASRAAGLLPCSSGENRILRLAGSTPPGSPSTSTTPSADSTAPASASSSAPSAMPTGSVPPITPAPDNMTCVTFKSGNRHTTRHHQRESPAPGSARQNRYTDPLHTASADRRHTFLTWDHPRRPGQAHRRQPASQAASRLASSSPPTRDFVGQLEHDMRAEEETLATEVGEPG